MLQYPIFTRDTWLRLYIYYPISVSQVLSFSRPSSLWPADGFDSWVNNVFFEPKTESKGNIVTYGTGDETSQTIQAKEYFAFLIVAKQ